MEEFAGAWSTGPFPQSRQTRSDGFQAALCSGEARVLAVIRAGTAQIMTGC
jgi:hypothetical protein